MDINKRLVDDPFKLFHFSSMHTVIIMNQTKVIDSHLPCFLYS